MLQCPCHIRARQRMSALRSYLADVSKGLTAAGVPHVAVTTTDPEQVQAVLDGVTVAGLEDFLWVGSLLETFHLTRHTLPGSNAMVRPCPSHQPKLLGTCAPF